MSGPAKTVDFLPERYRRATSRRRASSWQLLITLGFIGAFAATAVGLHVVRRDVRSEHLRISFVYDAEKSKESLLTATETSAARLRAYADLKTFLHHPWPRSRVFESLFVPLPDDVVIEKLRIAAAPKNATDTRTAAAAPVDADAASRTPQTDLAELRRAVEALDVVVALEGTAGDPASLHAYLSRMTNDRLFSNAELESIEALRDERKSGAKFTARIVVRPGWGLRGGPDAEDVAADAASTAAVAPTEAGP